MTNFSSLQAEYSRFYAIRNHPADGTEFEDWQKLPDEAVSVWAGRLQEQGQKVQQLIGDMAHLKPARAYHELTCYFREDVADLRGQLKTRNIELTL